MKAITYTAARENLADTIQRVCEDRAAAIAQAVATLTAPKVPTTSSLTLSDCILASFE